MTNSVKDILIYFNPSAGGGGNHSRVKNLYSRLVGVGYEVSLVETRRPEDHFIRRSVNSWKKTPDCIVVAGGDGTLHQIANGMLNLSSEKERNIPVTVFPIGSGNDWAKAWKISKRVSRWVADFQSAEFQQTHLIEIEGLLENRRRLYATNSMGIGLTGEIVQGLAERRATGFFKAGYLTMTIKAFLNYSYPEFRVRVQNEKISGDFLSLNIGVNQTTGGGMKLFPQNKNPRKMACTIITKVRFWHIPSLLYELYFGDLSKKSPVVRCFKADVVQVEAVNRKEPAEVDGEKYCFHSFTAKFSEHKLTIIVPGLV